MIAWIVEHTQLILAAVVWCGGMFFIHSIIRNADR